MSEPNFECAVAMDRTEQIYQGLFGTARRLSELQVKMLLVELSLGLKQLAAKVCVLSRENAQNTILYGKPGDGAEQRKHLRGRSFLEDAVRGGSPEFHFDRMKPYRQDVAKRTTDANAETDGVVRVFELMCDAGTSGAAAGDQPEVLLRACGAVVAASREAGSDGVRAQRVP
jgi:hypothetical protein